MQSAIQFSISDAYTRSFVSPEEYHRRSVTVTPFLPIPIIHPSRSTVFQWYNTRSFGFSPICLLTMSKEIHEREWKHENGHLLFVTRRFDRVRALDVSIIFFIGRYTGDWLAINNSPEPAWLKIDFYFTDNYRSWIAFRTVRPFASHLRYSSFAKLYIIDYLIHVLLYRIAI